MTITEPTSDAYEVTAPIELSDRVQALLLDHFLDHLHLLTHVSSDDPISHEFALVCLLFHRRYRPFLDGDPVSHARLIRVLQADTTILFTAYLRILSLPPEQRAPFYRAVLKTVPFTGHAAYQRGDDDSLRLQFDPPPPPPAITPSGTRPAPDPPRKKRTVKLRR